MLVCGERNGFYANNALVFAFVYFFNVFKLNSEHAFIIRHV